MLPLYNPDKQVELAIREKTIAILNEITDTYTKELVIKK
jgi:hypothetical protein